MHIWKTLFSSCNLEQCGHLWRPDHLISSLVIRSFEEIFQFKYHATCSGLRNDRNGDLGQWKPLSPHYYEPSGFEILSIVLDESVVVKNH